MSSVDEPTSKRARLASPEVESTPAAPSVPTAPSLASSTNDAFSLESAQTGLFASLVSTLGIRASTEEEVGITRFVNSEGEGFSGIIKHRFTDFLVYEVGLDGVTVRLTNTKLPQTAARTVESNEKAEEVVKPMPAPIIIDGPLWNDISAAAMYLMLGSSSSLASFQTFVEAGAPPRVDNRTKVVLPEGEAPAVVTPTTWLTDVIEAKEARTAIHRALRENFRGRLISETREKKETGEQRIEVLWKGPGGKNVERKSKNDSRAKRSQGLATDHPPYIHFTLQKTNREAHDALSSLCRALHLQPRDIGTAGTKDKRAVTVQRVSIKRGTKTIEEVYRASRGGGGGRGGRGGRGRGGYGGAQGERGVVLGDFCYADHGFELGMLKGNKFVITLRDVITTNPASIPLSIDSLSKRGFINYYGMQRFGTSPIPTHAIGLALLQCNWALACHMILRPREGEGEDVQAARLLWEQKKTLPGGAGAAARAMPRRCVAERAVLEHYERSNNITDHLAALTRIPKNLRMMYVHAWQSYIWNRVLSERVKLFGADVPIVGDLIYVGEDEEEKEEEIVEGEGEVVESLDADLTEGGPEDIALSLQPGIAPAPSICNGPRTLEIARTASKTAKVRHLTAEDIDSGRYTIFDVVLPLPGFAVLYPHGALGELYEKIVKEDGLDLNNLFRKQKEYSLGGAYRKLLHLPSEVNCSLLIYSDPAQDLARSDEDVLTGRNKFEVETLEDRLAKGGKLEVESGEKLGLRVELTLGSSTYATMALREILKTSTSEAHQRGLTVAMEASLASAAPIEEAVATSEVQDEPMQE